MNKFIELLNTAFIAIITNKVRSILTMLGVIIGVFAVVSMLSLGNGIQSYVADQFAALGSDLVLIAPGKVDFGDDPAKAFSKNQLDDIHVDLIKRYAGEHIEYISPSIRTASTVEYKTNKYYASLTGSNEEANKIFNISLLDTGRFFTKAEVKAKKRVAVIGPLVKDSLFPNQNPIGKKVKINGDTYTVIGEFSKLNERFDDRVLVPYTALRNTLDIDNFSGISIKIKNINDLDNSMRQIELALLRDLDANEFTVLSQEEILGSIQNILGVLTLGLGAIAGISLLVGGIGIMNIMLVSVTERTREIGLRKAVGASSINIGFQFMFESIILSLSGGLIGLLFGYLLTVAIKNFISTSLSLGAVLLALGFSVFVGIMFGTYPALKAAKKDPIEALRFE